MKIETYGEFFWKAQPPEFWLNKIKLSHEKYSQSVHKKVYIYIIYVYRIKDTLKPSGTLPILQLLKLIDANKSEAKYSAFGSLKMIVSMSLISLGCAIDFKVKELWFLRFYENNWF